MNPRSKLCLATLMTAVAATACDQTTTSPIGNIPGSPSAALSAPVGTPGGVVTSPTAGQVIVCKTTASNTTYNVPSTTSFTYNVSVSYPQGTPTTPDQYVSSVSLTPGQCATVFYRPVAASPVGGDVALVSVTEAPLSGYLLQNLSYSATPYPIELTFNGISYPTQSGSNLQILVNYYHGYLVNYTNQLDTTTGIEGGGGASNVCVRSQGYYKTHQNVVSNILSNPTNTTTTYLSGGLLQIGGYTGGISASTITSLLSRPTHGDVRIIIERQLIAAELNILQGSSATTTILNEITEANTLLAKTTLTTADKTRLLQIATDLEAFNTGTTGVTGNSASCD